MKGTYRSRSPVKTFFKILGSAVGALVLSAAVLFVFLQRYIVYTAEGLRLDMPFIGMGVDPEDIIDRDAEPSPGNGEQTPPDGDPDTPPPYVKSAAVDVLNGVLIPTSALSDLAALDVYIDAARREGADCAVLDMKADGGSLAYKSTIETAVLSAAPSKSIEISEVLARLHESGFHVVARVSCFRDSLSAIANQGMALKTAGGSLWDDYSRGYWLSPFSASARQYVLDVVLELAGLGFDEIMLDNFALPTAELGWTESMSTPEGANITSILSSYLLDIISEIDDFDVFLSVVVTGDAMSAGADSASGQNAAVMARRVDRLCVYADAESLTGYFEKAAELVNSRDIQFVPIVSVGVDTGTASWIKTGVSPIV